MNVSFTIKAQQYKQARFIKCWDWYLKTGVIVDSAKHIINNVSVTLTNDSELELSDYSGHFKIGVIKTTNPKYTFSCVDYDTLQLFFSQISDTITLHKRTIKPYNSNYSIVNVQHSNPTRTSNVSIRSIRKAPFPFYTMYVNGEFTNAIQAIDKIQAIELCKISNPTYNISYRMNIYTKQITNSKKDSIQKGINDAYVVWNKKIKKQYLSKINKHRNSIMLYLDVLFLKSIEEN